MIVQAAAELGVEEMRGLPDTAFEPLFTPNISFRTQHAAASPGPESRPPGARLRDGP